MRARSFCLIGAALAFGVGIASAGNGQSASPLPPGPGHDVMARVCSGCHAPEVAAKQRLTRQGWTEMVELMASRGAPGTDAEFAQIVDYLSANFPAQPTAQVPAAAVPPGAMPTPHGG